MGLGETVRKIKNLEIQGATNVALEGVKALKRLQENGKEKEELEEAAEKIKNARPTEPALFNALEYVLTSGKFEETLNHFEKSKEKIAEFGRDVIKDADEVYTHCHSSTVVGVLEKGYKEHNFSINNTETRPVFQGRKTAKELARRGVQVDHFVDSAARFALKQSDYMLIGADAVNVHGDVYNKIGSRMIAEAASNLGVPVYVCTDSWKYHDETERGETVKIEERSPSEVWEEPPEKVNVRNPAFEKVPAERITGIITEIGVLEPDEFAEKVDEEYPEIFE